MSIYFENALTASPDSIFLEGCWHSNLPLLAVSSFAPEQGGTVRIYDDLGGCLPQITFPTRRYHSTALNWHPSRPLLATGWENGDFLIWDEKSVNNREFYGVNSPHQGPIAHLGFNQSGSRLISCDSIGSLVGWRLEINTPPLTLFHVEVKESITQIAFKLFNYLAHLKTGLEVMQNVDNQLNWRPKTTAKRSRTRGAHPSDNLIDLYVATVGGIIYHVNNQGICTEIWTSDGGLSITHLIFHPLKGRLIVMLEGYTVISFNVLEPPLGGGSTRLQETTRVKLSGRIQTRSSSTDHGLIWVGGNFFAILTGDLIVRIWDLETNDNFVLPIALKTQLSQTDETPTVNEVFTCLSYCEHAQTICAGTNIGRVYFWMRNFSSNSDHQQVYATLNDSWGLHNINSLSGTVKQMKWGTNHILMPLVYVNCVTNSYIMKEQIISYSFSPRIWSIQKSPNLLLLQSESHKHALQMPNHIKQILDVTLNTHHLLVSTGQLVLHYEIVWITENEFKLNLKNEFKCGSELILLYEKLLIILGKQLTTVVVTFRDLNGRQSGTNIETTSDEGEPIGLELNGRFLLIFTLEGFVKLYELNASGGKPYMQKKSWYIPDVLNGILMDFGEIIRAKCNCFGTKIALLIAATNLVPDGRLYVFDTGDDDDLDVIKTKPQFYDFYQISIEHETRMFIPMNFFWDSNDGRFLIGQGVTKATKNRAHLIATIFVAPDNMIYVHNKKVYQQDSLLIGISTPHIVLLENLEIEREIMMDFHTLTAPNATVIGAILEFNYNLCVGNMDAAFKAIKLVENPLVWTSLAKMCVQTGRLDVARVCLGHMGNARCAMGLRRSMDDPQLPPEAKIALLAIHLGMLDEAEDLYRKCERFDLLNRLLRMRNKMPDALELAKTKDRINLRNTHHRSGCELVAQGRIKDAIKQFEMAHTHKVHVPRLLLDSGQIQDLETYVMKANTDRDLLIWWAQYIESQGDLQMALKTYKDAQDVYSQVRIYCFLDEEQKAVDLARSTNDKASFYHLARYYETRNKHQEAVQFFTKANSYTNAVRLCREHNLIDELWTIGNVADQREKIECAKQLELANCLDQATILYHRAGQFTKALDLAFKSEQFEVLHQITNDLDATSDPELIQKCSQYFQQNQQYDKALDLLALAHQFDQAIKICIEHNVPLNERILEKLTPAEDAKNRNEILTVLGECLMKQGSYHLATKKFTQAGDKIRAMRALLKSGDTDKIVFFAGVSRQKEIYVMAANYLQALNWRNKPEIVQNIITFYTKGKALDLLVNFYISCAQVEIDEYQHYEKAVEALTEARRCLERLSKSEDTTISMQKSKENVEKKLRIIEKFVQIRRGFDRGDFQSGMGQCRELLDVENGDVEEAIRRGDIYSLMIHNCVKNGRFKEAASLLPELMQILGTKPILYYINRETIEDLATGLNVPINVLLPMEINKEPIENTSNEEVIEDLSLL